MAVYPTLSYTQRAAAFLTVSLMPFPAVVYALRHTSSLHRSTWRLVLCALVFLTIDDVDWYGYALAHHQVDGGNLVTEFFGPIGQAFVLAASLTLVSRRGRNDTGGLLDTTIVSMAVGALIWDVLVLPHLQAAGEPLRIRAAVCVDIFLVTGILGAMARLVTTARKVMPALWLLCAALTFSLAENVAMALTLRPNPPDRAAWQDILLMAAYTALGLGGLDRSSAALMSPGPPPRDDLSTGRLIFLGTALAAVPLVGGGRQILGYPVDGLALTIGTAAITPLVMVRIGRLSAQRARAERALQHEATHDALTGLANRRDFMTQLARAVADGRGLAVLFCDMDDFKVINDRLGHITGDRVLTEVAARLRMCVREADKLCRFGGDEFLILCPGASALEAQQVCHRIEEALSLPIELPGGPVPVGVSTGMVTSTGSTTVEEIIHRADEAMYAAKQIRRTRDRVQYSPEM